jgi:hypothetical protein
VCMIDEVRDLTSDLIECILLGMFYYLLFFRSLFCYTVQYCTPTSILLNQNTISESEQRRGPAPAVPEGAITVT